MTVKAYGAHAADQPVVAMDIARRDPGPRDVQIEIAYCGVCHSDLHTVRSEWGGTLYPCVPGHEIVGRVTAVGAQVSAFAPGDRVGVGCFVGSCGHCADCADGLENGACPNCGGSFAPRPIRPAAALARFPASTERVLGAAAPCVEKRSAA